jgi:hypothetical protein
MSEGTVHQFQHMIECLWQIGNGEFYDPPLKSAQSAVCRHGGEGSYEHPSKLLFVVYLTAEILI